MFSSSSRNRATEPTIFSILVGVLLSILGTIFIAPNNNKNNDTSSNRSSTSNDHKPSNPKEKEEKEKQDAFQLLGISMEEARRDPDEARALVSKTYRKLCLTWHPDRNRDEEDRAHEKMQEINSAKMIVDTELDCMQGIHEEDEEEEEGEGQEDSFHSDEEASNNHHHPQHYNDYEWYDFDFHGKPEPRGKKKGKTPHQRRELKKKHKNARPAPRRNEPLDPLQEAFRQYEEALRRQQEEMERREEEFSAKYSAQQQAVRQMQSKLWRKCYNTGVRANNPDEAHRAWCEHIQKAILECASGSSEGDDVDKSSFASNGETRSSTHRTTKPRHATLEACTNDMAVAVRLDQPLIVMTTLEEEAKILALKEARESANRKGFYIVTGEHFVEAILAPLDADGNTLLHFIAYFEATKCLNLLMSTFAEDYADFVLIKNHRGQVPLDFCPKEIAKDAQFQERLAIATKSAMEIVKETSPMGQIKTFLNQLGKAVVSFDFWFWIHRFLQYELGRVIFGRGVFSALSIIGFEIVDMEHQDGTCENATFFGMQILFAIASSLFEFTREYVGNIMIAVLTISVLGLAVVMPIVGQGVLALFVVFTTGSVQVATSLCRLGVVLGSEVLRVTSQKERVITWYRKRFSATQQKLFGLALLAPYFLLFWEILLLILKVEVWLDRNR